MARRGYNRLVVLIALLAIAAVAACFQYREDIRDLHLHYLVRPLTPRCTQDAPAWVAEIGSWARRHELPGVQLYLRQGGHVFECSFGKALSSGRREREMRTDDVFPYASLTKVLTSMLIVREHQKGVIDLDTSIYPLLNFRAINLKRRDQWERVSARMLLQHQGGFDRNRSGDPMLWPKPPCPNELGQLERVTMDFTPGTRFAYSNLGYCLLGVLLESAATTEFRRMVQEDISDPLGVRFVTVDGKQVGTALYFADAAEMERFASIDWAAHAAIGGLGGTARDFAEFLHALTPGRRFAEPGLALLAPLSSCDESRWRSCHGLAFYSHREPDRPRMFWHDGSLPGSSAFAALTADGSVLVLLANSRDPAKWVAMHDEIGKIVYQNLAGS